MAAIIDFVISSYIKCHLNVNFFYGTGVRTQGFTLAKLVLYCFSHTSSQIPAVLYLFLQSCLDTAGDGSTFFFQISYYDASSSRAHFYTRTLWLPFLATGVITTLCSHSFGLGEDVPTFLSA
jgi:hypothetical protein